MRVLIMGEFSGVVRDAFIKRGHDAVSCDLLPSESPGPHYQCDVRELNLAQFDIMVAHPDCTYLCSSGLHWNKRRAGRAEKTAQAIEFVKWLLQSPIEKIALENPVGAIGTNVRPADQYVNPWQFGHDASKKTGLWLKNLPPLMPTDEVPPRIVDGKRRWGNQTDSGQNKLAPSNDRWKLRAVTYQGIADAMAVQWG